MKPTKYSDFLQELPQLENEYADDIFLQDYLHTYLPKAMIKEIEPDLSRLGERTVHEILEWGREAELNKPELIQFNAWGKRIDEIKVSQGWKNLDRAAAEE